MANRSDGHKAVTAKKLATSLADLAAGGMLIPGQARDEWLLSFAKRVRNRVQPNDPRLQAFTAHADGAGYVWIPEEVGAVLTRAKHGLWSFDRTWDAVATAAATATPDREEIENAAQDAAHFEKLAGQGWRMDSVHTGGDGAGVIFVRDDAEPAA